MKSLLILIGCSALVGVGVGAMLGYVEAGSVEAGPAADEKVRHETAPAPEIPTLPGPRAEVPESIFHFDRIERGTSMRHAFVIRNLGGKPLHVSFVSNTCKCTAVELAGKVAAQGESMTIAPGETSDVTLEWAAKTAAGPFRHGATFTTNDPRQSRIELMVEGNVVESTAMSPSELLFGTVHAGGEQTTELYLMSFLDADVQVLGHEVTDPTLAELIEVTITPAEKDELPSPGAIGGVKVSATFHAGKTIGAFNGWLNLTTNLASAEKLTIPILGQVVGDISIFGPGWNARQGLLRLGVIRSDQGKSLRLNLAVRGEHAIGTRFTVASVDPPELKVTLGEPRPMGKAIMHTPLTVEVLAGTRPLVRMGEPSSIDAQIVLKSNHPLTPEFKLRVHFAVTR